MIKQAIRNKKRVENTSAFATARNTMMLYDINRDPNKSSEVTIANFLPHPDIYLEDNTNITLDIKAITARRVLNSFSEMKPFAKMLLEPELTQLRIIAKN